MPKLRPLAVRFKQALKRSLYALLPHSAINLLVRHKMPRSGQVEATVACNLRCPLCVTHLVPRKSPHMGLAEVDNVLEGCSSRLRYLNFHLQGEPLLNRDLFELIRRCSERGVETSFGTNGMLLDRFIDEILDSGLSRISIAIDGADAETYDKYRIGGDFEQVVHNVKALLEAKRARGSATPTVQLQTVMFSYNEDTRQRVVEFLDDLEPDEVALKQPSYFFDLSQSEKLGAEPIESERAEEAAKEFLEKVDTSPDRQFVRDDENPELYRHRKLCPQLERASILSDGRVVACCMDAVGATCFGNVQDEPFRKIWSGPKHKAVLSDFMDRKLDLCNHCTLS